ncbi:hypothetical protein VTK73DRAFT_4863 [Phialemonium thermophilum]|uniref:MIT domain-containing protein n=1 Tax=Phialemonium thermophilum TaxID=223376 RepID=A0ABR3V5C8_9PEZI
MLSKALQKANMAVQLDNAQSFEGARIAYLEACDLLQQVLVRTAGEGDRKKLEAIHRTYTIRIEELDQQLPPAAQEDKELPQRPDSEEIQDVNAAASGDDDEAVIATATVQRMARDRNPDGNDGRPMSSLAARPSMSQRRQQQQQQQQQQQTIQIGSAVEMGGAYEPSPYDQYTPQSSFSKPLRRIDQDLVLQQPVDRSYLPPPLSPRRVPSPAHLPEPNTAFRAEPSYSSSAGRLAPAAIVTSHQRKHSHESVSWLDPIDESVGSPTSSVHSRSSSMRIMRKPIRPPSGDTEAEFDAALDDAIEAAYDDGYELEEEEEEEVVVVVGQQQHDETRGRAVEYPEDTEDAVARALRRVELARERVRQSEREAMELANERERRFRQQQQQYDEEDARQQQQQQQQPPPPPPRRRGAAAGRDDAGVRDRGLCAGLGQGEAWWSLGAAAAAAAA